MTMPVFNPGPTVYINKGTKSYMDPPCLGCLLFVSWNDDNTYSHRDVLKI